MSVFAKIKNFYLTHEDHLSASSLVAGFLFDIYILNRIDRPEENLWIISHLVVAVLGIFILNFYENQERRRGEIANPYYWLTMMVQFAFGGLLSTFLVFYFRSAAISASWPFLLVLVIAFACNEMLKQHYSRLTFQISYFFLCTFLFSIYYVPILFGEFGPNTFLYSGFLSLGVTAIFLFSLFQLTMEKFKKSARAIFASVLGIYFGLNVLYFTNIIPPIPLSLKDAGVFHSVSKNKDGNYDVKYERRYFINYLKLYDSFSYVSGEPVYIYSAVFSPTNLNVNIVHEWQYFDEAKKEWIKVNTIRLDLRGGRDGGFRTYSLASNIFDGYWRVNVKTTTGQMLGRIRFIAKEVKNPPLLYSGVKI
jgi:MFS family permease